MKKMKKTPLAAAMGTAVISTLSAANINAAENPFAMTELSDGYMQLAEADKGSEMKCGASMGMKEGSCGEGKCGSMMGNQPKVKEGKCAGNKKMPPAAKMTEGKCGEGKCGSMMQGGKMKKGMEGVCGEMMKGKEGSCGELVDGKKKSGKKSGWPVHEY